MGKRGAGPERPGTSSKTITISQRESGLGIDDCFVRCWPRFRRRATGFSGSHSSDAFRNRSRPRIPS